jgi:hypothetical protein
MRASEKVVLLTALLVPVLVVTLGWPTFVKWVTGPPATQPTPEVAGAAATSVAEARAVQPAARPTVGAPPTVQPNEVNSTPQPTPAAPTAVPEVAAAATAPALAPTTAPAAGAAPALAPTTAPAAGAAPALAPTTAPAAATAAPVEAPTRAPSGVPAADDPSQAVASFYSLVSRHDFDPAAQLWSPHMRAAFPPQQNINQRFSQTQSIRLQRVDVVNRDSTQATVAVDLVESAATGQRHYVGTWQLVRGAGGWMLDQPQLQPAP